MRARGALGLAALALALAACSSTVVGSASPPSPAPTGAGAASGDTVTCAWTADGSGSSVAALQPPPDAPATGTIDLHMNTTQGDLVLTLDSSGAPCAVSALTTLATQGFFDNSPCHRETDSPGLQVLQCGDPTGTGAGGPPWNYPTDVDGTETYPRGTVAMANSGQGFDGSQFFLVWGDAQLPPSYTVVGRVDPAGQNVLDTIAANGNDGSNGPGDGAPNKPVIVTTMRLG